MQNVDLYSREFKTGLEIQLDSDGTPDDLTSELPRWSGTGQVRDLVHISCVWSSAL